MPDFNVTILDAGVGTEAVVRDDGAGGVFVLVNDAGQGTEGAGAASLVATGDTRSPFAHTLVYADGRIAWLYQSGNGLVMRISTDGGRTWSAATTVDSKANVYPSVLADPSGNLHLVYSQHGQPGQGDEVIYYRPLLWGGDGWTVGAEQQVAGGGSLYDSAVAGRRNATIWADDNGRLIVTYVRTDAGAWTDVDNELYMFALWLTGISGGSAPTLTQSGYIS